VKKGSKNLLNSVDNGAIFVIVLAS